MNFHSPGPLALEGPAIFFGGPYSNLHALDALLAQARRLGVAPGNIVSTGDLVAYCADAKAVVARVRETGLRFVRGNCEEQIAAGAADCGCGFAPGGQCERLSADWFAHAMRELDGEDAAFLGRAPTRLDLSLNGLRVAVIHGAATQINRFVFASTPARIKEHDLDLLGVDGIVAGHSGLPFTQRLGRRFWHNPGALGMPANEGLARVWYSLVRPGPRDGELTIEPRALEYDFEAAARAMERAGLARDYAATLRTGLWPNCDALPVAEARAQGAPLAPSPHRISRSDKPAGQGEPAVVAPAPTKFRDPERTAGGETRGRVPLAALETLWINTGTLCNLACASCYIESSPRNDRLAYVTAAEAAAFYDEIARDNLPIRTIGFTGGEPFLNRDLIDMLDDALARGFQTLVLTNAMKPMRKPAEALARLREAHGARLALRVSLDHYTRELHELERGARSFQPTLDGLSWLVREGFAVTVAGRLYSGERAEIVRAGYSRLFSELGLALDAFDPTVLVLFPELDAHADVPEITEGCWSILGKAKTDVMCATSRMVVKRKGAAAPAVVACTLLPYDPQFELGPTLKAAAREVRLNHPHCAAFCVLGGASCSG